MYIIYFLIITVLILTNSITVWFLLKRIKYSKQLFIRAWELELKLIHIYQSVPLDVQRDIDDTLSKIKPL